MSDHIDVGKIERKRERKRRNVCKICVSLIRIKRERQRKIKNNALNRVRERLRADLVLSLISWKLI